MGMVGWAWLLLSVFEVVWFEVNLNSDGGCDAISNKVINLANAKEGNISAGTAR